MSDSENSMSSHGACRGVSDSENGGPDKDSSTYQMLSELATTAREQRCSGDHHNGLDSEFPLIGKCFDNAYVLYHLLVENGLKPDLIEGTTTRVADELIQDGVDVRALDSLTDYGWAVHYWIAVEVGGQEWQIDIASDSWEHLGECVVCSDLPDSYIEFSDSRQRGAGLFQDVSERGDRCAHCGDHAYTEGGCPVCTSITETTIN